jgi:hypothetical protein
MTQEDETFTVYDANGNEWTLTVMREHSADGVPLEAQLWTLTPKGVWSHVTPDGDRAYRVVETWQLLTADPPV